MKIEDFRVNFVNRASNGKYVIIGFGNVTKRTVM
jgi:hypothetical protein